MRDIFSLILVLLSLMILGCQCDEGGGGLTTVSPDLYVNEEAIDFGKVLVGSSAQRELRITNKGDADLTFESTEIVLKSHKSPKPFSGTIDRKDFSSIGDVVIEASKEKKMILIYAPTVVGVDTAELHIKWYKNKTTQEVVEKVITLRGEGAKPQIDLCLLDDSNKEVKCQSSCPNNTSCVEKDFGELDLNKEAFARFTIKNLGGLPLDILDSRVMQCKKGVSDCTFEQMVDTTSVNEFYMTDPSSGSYSGTLSEYPKSGSTVIVTVRYKALSGGVTTGALKVESADQVTPKVFAKLTAKGIAPRMC